MWTTITARTQRANMWLKTKGEVLSLDHVESIAVRPGPAKKSETGNNSIYTYDILAYTTERDYYDHVESIAVRPGPAKKSETGNNSIYTYDILAYTTERDYYIEREFATHDEAMARMEEIFKNFEK